MIAATPMLRTRSLPVHEAPAVFRVKRGADHRELRFAIAAALQSGRRVNVLSETADSLDLVCRIVPTAARATAVITAHPNTSGRFPTVDEAAQHAVMLLDDALVAASGISQGRQVVIAADELQAPGCLPRVLQALSAGEELRFSVTAAAPLAFTIGMYLRSCLQPERRQYEAHRRFQSKVQQGFEVEEEVGF